MRVLHVIPGLSARTGGPPVAVVESSLALQRLGVDVSIFTTDVGGTASAPGRVRAGDGDLPEGAGAIDVRMFPVRPPRRFVFSPELLRSLTERTREFDVVHIHSLFLFPQLAAYRGARRSGVPYVVSPRGALDPHLRRRGRVVKLATEVLWQRGMLARAAALHTTSAEEARWIVGVAPRVPRSIVPNGIDWARFQDLPPASEFRDACLGDSAAPVLLYLGRLSHKKGLDVLVRAFAVARRSVPDALLVIAGPDDESMQPALAALAAREGVAGSVIFTGMLRRRARLAALAAANVWALPSRGENFGIAVAEAMAAGLPVVLSPEVNIAADIAAAGAGVVCARTAEAFAAEIASLLNDRAARESLGQRARAFARRYDWDAVAPQLAEMYERAAA